MPGGSAGGGLGSGVNTGGVFGQGQTSPFVFSVLHAEDGRPIDIKEFGKAIGHLVHDPGILEAIFRIVHSEKIYRIKYQVGPDDSFDANKLEWKLQLAIQQLPEKQRIVFTLRYYDEMPYEEMSKVLETSEGALKASYHHAAKKIENYILTQ